ncbi:hypothetical protein ABZ543_27480 [Streptomyces roseifaciens]
MRLRTRAAGRLVAPILLAGCFLTGCAPSQASRHPAEDDVIKAAGQVLTDSCLTRQGLKPSRPGRRTSYPAPEEAKVAEALFGSGRPELSVSLSTGHVVSAHTDGCLAAAQQRLYGDQPRWFRVSTIVNNLGPEARHTHRSLDEVRAKHRAEIADWMRLRTHALAEATALLDDPSTKGHPRP